MKLILNSILLAASLTAISASSYAQQTDVDLSQMTWQGFAVKEDSLYVSPAPGGSQWPSVNLWHIDGYGPMYMFCVERLVGSSLDTGYTFDSQLGNLFTEQGDPISLARENQLKALMSHATPLLDSAWQDYYDTTGTWSYDASYLDLAEYVTLAGIASAMQLVTWEILGENTANDLDVFDGDLAVRDDSLAPSPNLSHQYAKTFTSNLNDGTWTDVGGIDLYYGQATENTQNMLFAGANLPVVPEPSSALLIGLTGALAFLRRKRA